MICEPDVSGSRYQREAMDTVIFKYGLRQAFYTIWMVGLYKYDELKGLDLEWQILDGCMTKAPLAIESVGKNPTDRGKMVAKRSILTERHGLPIAVVVLGANVHDVRRLRCDTGTSSILC